MTESSHGAREPFQELPVAWDGGRFPRKLGYVDFSASICLPINRRRAIVDFGHSADPACMGGRIGLIEPARRRKSLKNDTFDLDLLQAFEIPQNHQDVLWKSLEETSGSLEIFGKSLERAGRD